MDFRTTVIAFRGKGRVICSFTKLLPFLDGLRPLSVALIAQNSWSYNGLAFRPVDRSVSPDNSDRFSKLTVYLHVELLADGWRHVVLSYTQVLAHVRSVHVAQLQCVASHNG